MQSLPKLLPLSLRLIYLMLRRLTFEGKRCRQAMHVWQRRLDEAESFQTSVCSFDSNILDDPINLDWFCLKSLWAEELVVRVQRLQVQNIHVGSCLFPLTFLTFSHSLYHFIFIGHNLHQLVFHKS